MRKKKIKVGDSVKISEQNLSMILFDHKIHEAIAKQKGKVEGVAGCMVRVSYNIPFVFNVPTNLVEKIKTSANDELQEAYARFMSGHTPISFADRIEREHIQRRMRVISQSDFLKEVNPSEHEINPKSRYIPKIMLDAEFWVKYEADLAKDLSMAYAKQGIDPMEAVGKAKEIVKQLKNK